MTLHGKIQNGMVVFEGNPQLPEGAPVTVLVDPPRPAPAANDDQMSEEEHQRILAIMDRIAALPIEGSGEPFSGRDHDKVLYGKR
jgi:hypothetical protein